MIIRLSKQQEKIRWKLTTMNVQGSQVYLFFQLNPYNKGMRFSAKYVKTAIQEQRLTK